MNQSVALKMAAGGPAPTTVPPLPQPFTLKLVIGLVGVLFASLCSGLNDRVTDIALVDVRGALSISSDEGSWLIGAYQAAAVAATMVAPWMAMTFSIRRFAMGMTAGFILLAAVIPFAPNLTTLILLRSIQGVTAASRINPAVMPIAKRRIEKVI